MAIPTMNFFPFVGNMANGGQGKGQNDGMFDNLLSAMATPGSTGNSQDKTVVMQGKAKPLQQVEQVLQALAGAKVDLNAPGLGLTAAQREALAAKLEKLATEVSDAAQLLGSLMAMAQTVAPVKLQDLVALTKLLSTGAEGAISSDALKSNLQLLTQAVQLVASSGGKTTLLEAVQELTGPNDAFAQQLASAMAEAAADEQAPAEAVPIEATGPPKVPIGDGAQASVTAGSNGREMTPVTPTGSPADGAAQEASQPNMEVLADLIQALVEGKGASGAQANATPAEPALPGVPGQATPATVRGAPITTPATASQTTAVQLTVSPATQGPQVPVVAAAASQPAQVVPAPQPAQPVAAVVAAVPGAQVALAVAAAAQAGAQPVQQPRRESAPAPAAPAKPVPAPVGQMAVVAAAPKQEQPQVAAADAGQAQASASLAAAVTPGQAAGAPAAHDGGSNGNDGQSGNQPLTAPVPGLVTPAAPAADLTQPAPPEAPRVAVEQAIVDQIVQNATVALRNGQQEFRIQLKPDFLGAMEVRISVDNGSPVVRMAAQNAATHHLIETNLNQLRQAFGTSDVRVEHVATFGTSDAPWSFSQGGHQGYWQGQQGQAGFRPMPEAVPFSGQPEAEPVALPVEEPVTQNSQSLSPTAGAIDLQA